ncbi:MAG TPA: response regulator [Bacteroidetes bacterium]|nr:chemotaxis protein CheY [bacterium BMS3Bbin04]HDO64957.1 response regulator [Bacteroidota bacterium]HEX04082.1 response regulator [Bacteroidota bacterium]
MRILVVDDVAAMRKTVRKILESGGYTEVVEAISGTEAIGKLKKVDLIFTDLKMPGMSGLSFIKAVRERSAHREIPIIVITAINSRDYLARALRYGANDYLTKPFSVQQLLDKVDALQEDTSEDKNMLEHS